MNMLGLLSGRTEVGGEALVLIRSMTGRVFKHAVSVGGNLSVGAKGTLEDAVEGAGALGVGADDATVAATSGLLEANVELTLGQTGA